MIFPECFKIFLTFSAAFVVSHENPIGVGGGYLIPKTFVQWDEPLSTALFSPNFSITGYQNKAVSLEPIIKTCQMGKFCPIGLLFSPIFMLWSILLTKSCPESGTTRRYEFWSLIKRFFCGTPCANLEQVPPIPG